MEKTGATGAQTDPDAPTQTKATVLQAIQEKLARGEEVDIPVHDAANIFPRILKQDLDELAADIKERGLLHPITLHPDGSILDGVNRWKACRHIKLIPKFETWKGRSGEEADFVISRNLHRRHLTERQRSIVAAKLAKLKRGRPKPADLPNMTQGRAAAALNVSERSARKASKILAKAPANIVSLVEQDKLSLDAAEAVAKAPDQEKARLASMSDEEALATAKAYTRKKKEALATEQLDGSLLIRRLKSFVADWEKASDQTRSKLLDWLHQANNAATLAALMTLAPSSPANTSNP